MTYQVLKDKIQQSNTDIIKYTDENISKLIEYYQISYMYPRIYILATQNRSIEYVMENIEGIDTLREVNQRSSDIMNHQIIMDDIPDDVEMKS